MSNSRYAIVRDNDTSWAVTTDRDRILAVRPDDVIFIDNYDDAMNKLDALYPASDPSLSRIVSHDSTYRNRARDLDMVDRFHVLPVEQSRYLYKNDFKVLVNVVKRLKLVYVEDVQLRYYAPFSRADCQDAGIVLRTQPSRRCGYQGGPADWYQLRWNPKGVAAAKKGVATKARKALKRNPPPTNYMQAAMRTMSMTASGCIPYIYVRMHSQSDGSYSAYQLMTLAGTFNTLFGADAHRAVKTFRTLAGNWPTNVHRKRAYRQIARDINEAKTRKNMGLVAQLQKQQLALRWLDAEIARPLPPPRKRFTPVFSVHRCTLTSSKNAQKEAARKASNSKKSRGKKARRKKRARQTT